MASADDDDLVLVGLADLFDRFTDRGEFVVSDPPPRAPSVSRFNWPGRGEGLSDRESAILALITQDKSNADVAMLTHLSPNTVESDIRTIYRKIKVSSRTEAALWGVGNGFRPRPKPHRSPARPPLIGCLA